jgi:hypothetical protein
VMRIRSGCSGLAEPIEPPCADPYARRCRRDRLATAAPMPINVSLLSSGSLFEPEARAEELTNRPAMTERLPGLDSADLRAGVSDVHGIHGEQAHSRQQTRPE